MLGGTHDHERDPEQRRPDARARLRGVPDTAGRHRAGRGHGARDRLPAHRHRRRVRQRTRSRPGHPPLGPGPRRRVHRDEDLDQRLRLRPDAARLRQERRQARRRPDRPADPAPGAPRAVRPHPGGVSRAGDPARRRPGAGDRRQQLHARAPRRPAEAGHGGPRGEPGRGAPVLHPAGRAGRGRRPRRPHPGLVADRRHHQLPRYRDQHLRRPGHRLDRRRPRQDPGAGDDPLAPAGGTLRDPEVGAARTDRRELRRVRLRAHHRRAQAPGRTRHRRARRPRADDVTLEAYGRAIPEA